MVRRRRRAGVNNEQLIINNAQRFAV